MLSFILLFSDFSHFLVSMTNTREHKLIGQADAFLQVLDQVSQLTDLERPVLIVGERGTGKELIAQRLHFLSKRWAKPFIKMNCAAISETLLESELFGHEAGAFTGAQKRHIGRFERANLGSLFMDELATLSSSTQEKLLRLLEYGELERLGGSETITLDTRLIAATNVDLPSLADDGKFRHDLLDRLAFDVITLPPLRARKDDILLLAEHFAIKMCKELGLDFFPGFDPVASQTLLNYPWPGNIRELKNTIERSIYRHKDSDTPLHNIITDPFESPFRLKPEKIHKAVERQAPPTAKLDSTLKLPLDFTAAKDTWEKSLVEQALKQTQFHQKLAAQQLQLSYHQFRNLLKKHNIRLGR